MNTRLPWKHSFSDFNQTCNFLDRFSNNPETSNSVKIRLVAEELFHAHGTTWQGQQSLSAMLRTSLKSAWVSVMSIHHICGRAYLQLLKRRATFSWTHTMAWFQSAHAYSPELRQRSLLSPDAIATLQTDISVPPYVLRFIFRSQQLYKCNIHNHSSSSPEGQGSIVDPSLRYV